MFRLLILLCLVLVGCQSKDGVGDQCQGIQKIEAEILKNKKKAVIYSYTYNNATIYLVDDCLNCADRFSIAYDCDGTEVCRFGGLVGVNTCPDFNSKATDKELVWKTE